MSNVTTPITSTSKVKDLRQLTNGLYNDLNTDGAPSIVAIAELVPSVSTGFLLLNSVDHTKRAQFNLSSITTNTTQILSVPNASGALVLDSATQTLTNKTLTFPAISTISNSGTLTLPTGTDTLIGRNTVDTLTNKTINYPVITIRDSASFTVQNTANATKQARFDLSAISNGTIRTYSYPDISDTLVTLSATQTLTNKTLTFPAISTISNSGTLTLPTGTDTLIGRNTVDVLTNKSFTTFNTTGNVLIGTATDLGQRLQVVGSTDLLATINITGTNPGSGFAQPSIRTVSDQTFELKNLSGGGYTFTQVGIGEFARFAPSGNFLIGGTTDGSGKLQVFGQITASGDIVSSSGSFSTSSTTANIANASATTVNIAGTGTVVNVGSGSGTLTLNNPTIASSAATLSLFSTPTTISAFGAATVLNIGNTSNAQTINIGSGSNQPSTYNFGSGSTVSGSTKTVNLGTNGASGSTTNINIGSVNGGITSILSPAVSVTDLSATNITTSGQLNVNGGSITTSATTANIVNVSATTVNFAGASTNLTIGATSGTTTIRNALVVSDGITGTLTGNATTATTATNLSGGTVNATTGTFSGSVAINNGTLTSTASNISLFNTTPTSVNAFGSATTVNIGSTLTQATFNFGNIVPGATGSIIKAGYFYGDGSNITGISASASGVTTDTTTNSDLFLVFADSASGVTNLKTGSTNLTYNPLTKAFGLNGPITVSGTGTFAHTDTATSGTLSTVNIVYTNNASSASTANVFGASVTSETIGTNLPASSTGLAATSVVKSASGLLSLTSGISGQIVLENGVAVTNANTASILSPEFNVYTGSGITNLYGLRIYPQSNINVTNPWAIYQSGSSDLNYMAGNLLIGSSTSNGSNALQVTGTSTFSSSMTVASTVNAVDFNSTSDITLKSNVVTAMGLPVVRNLRGVEFDFIKSGKHSSGVIAQEIEEVLPHIVENDVVSGLKYVSYPQIIAHLIEAIKDLDLEIKKLKSQ